MLGAAYLAFVLGGTSYAAYLDLKTSEVPDYVSVVVAVGGLLFHAGLSIGTMDATPFLLSLGTGTALFLLGWLMYLAGSWGGADAFVLGALGFALPRLPPGVAAPVAAPWPFPLSLLMTVFLVGSVYSILYAIFVAITAEGFLARFRSTLSDRTRKYAVASAGFVAAAAISGVLAVTRFGAPVSMVVENVLLVLAAIVLFLVLSSFLKVVENELMRHEIPVEELEAGAVLADPIDLEAEGGVEEDPAEQITAAVARTVRDVSPVPLPEVSGRVSPRIVGLTGEQVEEIRETRDTVAVRTGVRFIVAFPAAVLLLLLVGDPLYLLITSLA